VADEKVTTVRIVGSVLSIMSKTESNPSSNMVTTAAVLQGVGLSPLLMGTLGFISKMLANLPLFHISHLLIFFYLQSALWATVYEYILPLD
jgi:hypothetical protein